MYSSLTYRQLLLFKCTAVIASGTSPSERPLREGCLMNAPHIHATTVRRTLMHVVCSKGSRGAVASTVTLFDSVMSFRHMGLQTESCAKGAPHPPDPGLECCKGRGHVCSWLSQHWTGFSLHVLFSNIPAAPPVQMHRCDCFGNFPIGEASARGMSHELGFRV